MEQRHLSVGRALPIELLGVETGCGARRRRGEELADRGNESVRGDIGQNASRVRRIDDIGDAIHRGDRDRETGYLFPPGDPQRLAEGVFAALADQNSWPCIRAQASEFIDSERSWAHSVAGYGEVYRRILQH